MLDIAKYYIESLLSNKSYRELKIAQYLPNGDVEDELTSVVKDPFNPKIEYRVIDMLDNFKTGYTGYAFRKYINNIASKEIIIAHRGTDDDGNKDKKNNDYDYQANRYIKKVNKKLKKICKYI